MYVSLLLLHYKILYIAVVVKEKKQVFFSREIKSTDIPDENYVKRDWVTGQTCQK